MPLLEMNDMICVVKTCASIVRIITYYCVALWEMSECTGTHTQCTLVLFFVSLAYFDHDFRWCLICLHCVYCHTPITEPYISLLILILARSEPRPRLYLTIRTRFLVAYCPQLLQMENQTKERTKHRRGNAANVSECRISGLRDVIVFLNTSRV